MPDTEPMRHRMTSRKFIAVMFWQAVFTALLLGGKLSSDQYIDVTTLLLIGYLVINAGQHVMEGRK